MTIPSAVNVSAVVQILILYLVIYSILKAAKGSRFGQVLMGVGILAASMAAFTYVFHFDVLSIILRGLLVYLAISTVVIFQPEIRRILSQVGAFGTFERPKYDAYGAATPEYVADAIMKLAAAKTGALIAFERGISLRSYEETGIRLDARFSLELAKCIFTPPLPLHDGGLTMRNGHVSAAHCVFPVSNNPAFVGHGLRHRAAAGLSEETDALVVVVSEETGNVSVAHNGRLLRCSGPTAEQSLIRWISKAMPSEHRRGNKFLAKVFERLIRKGPQKK